MSRFIVIVIAGLLVAPSMARGDGMISYHVEIGDAEIVPVEAEVQRAVLWYRDGIWELTLQPVFPRAEGEAAWIVSFPVVPEIEARNVAFLDELEALTAPVFVPYCVELEAGGWFGCAGSAVDEARQVLPGAVTHGVTVWEAGVTDELEYVVLEAAGADALIAWLEENQYQVPEALQQQPQLLQAQFIFAAKLSGNLDPEAPLSPLAFRLPGIAFEDIAYPLRLTALVAPDDGMELVLWVVTEDQALLPRTVPWLPYSGGQEVSQERWAANTALVRKAFPPSGGLILGYSGALQSNPIYSGAEVFPPGPGFAVSAAELGLDRRSTWDDGILEMISSGATVARFQGVLGADAMEQDLAFETASFEELPGVDNFFWEKVSCGKIDDGMEATVSRADPPIRRSMRYAGGFAVIALGLLAGLLVLRRVHG